MLDFSADAAEGPIRAYLLDVADTEEQDMALNIHAFSAGKTQSLCHICIIEEVSTFGEHLMGTNVYSSTSIFFSLFCTCNCELLSPL